MYHIKNDKRSQTSAKLISEALTRCLQKKDFSKITISDLQRESTVGRATFYRLFDNLSDVLAYQCDMIFEEVRQRIDSLDENVNNESVVIFIESWMNHHKLLETIFECNRTDILIEAHRKRADDIKHFFYPEHSMTDVEFDYWIAISTSTLIALLTMWVYHGKKDSAREVLQHASVAAKVSRNLNLF